MHLNQMGNLLNLYRWWIKMTKLETSAILEKISVQTKKEGKIANWDIAVKDNIQVLGTHTTASSKMLENFVSVYQATVVDKLLSEGAHLVCKTSMDELAMGGSNRSAVTGPVVNPYDETRISGGSSGGSAALVGAGKVRAALGTDTGDSIRKPASYCGCVGLKPTYGRISRYGVIPYAPSLDHVGFFTRNVADAAVLLEVAAGRDDRDMTSSFEDVEAYSEFLDMDLEGKRIGVFKSVHDHIENKEMIALYETFAKALEAKGAVLVEKTMDLSLMRSILGTYVMIANAEATSSHANLDGVRFGHRAAGESLEEVMMNSRGEGFGFEAKRRFILGAYAFKHGEPEILFNKAKRVRRLIVDHYVEMFDDIDVLVSLAAPNVAPKIEDRGISDWSDEELIANNYMAIDNLSGFPSMTIPLGFLDEMPAGLNISARPFEEATLLAYASAFESIIDWKGRFF